MHTLVKQPGETFWIRGGITNVISGEESIVIGSCSVTAVDVNGSNAADIIDAAGIAVDDTTKVKVRVKKDTTIEAESPYKITFKIVTDGGNTWEVDVYLQIRDL